MDAPTRENAPGDLRVSDADRDRALAELSGHYQAGRLTLEEFEERSGQALKARTVRELKDLFTDLPRDRTAGTVTAGSGASPVSRAGLPVGRIAIVAGAAVAAIAIVAAVAAGSGSGHHGGVFLPLPIIIVLLVIRKAVLGNRRDGYAGGRLGDGRDRLGYARDRLEGRGGLEGRMGDGPFGDEPFRDERFRSERFRSEPQMPPNP